MFAVMRNVKGKEFFFRLCFFQPGNFMVRLLLLLGYKFRDIVIVFIMKHFGEDNY